MEYCRIYTSFYSNWLRNKIRWIGILPYYYFLLLRSHYLTSRGDWKTAVFILPSTEKQTMLFQSEIGRLPYYYFLLLMKPPSYTARDWKTAVLLLPSTPGAPSRFIKGLEDCRIITSFYSYSADGFKQEIGRLPYYYFPLLHAC